MKTKQFLVALLVPFACACSNENLNEAVDNSTQPQVIARSAENMLNFDSEASFQQAVEAVRSMESPEEKETWIKTNFGDFQSMQSVYNEASAEAENLGETEMEYTQFMSKYTTLYFPMYGEDYGFYIPLKNLDIAYLVNSKGDVCIAGNVVNKKDITSYYELMYLGRAYYDSGIKSLTDVSTELKDGTVVGEKYEAGWHKENGKKINFKVRRLVRNGLKLHIEISFRKKTIFGWTNYSSYTHLTGNLNLYTDAGQLVQTLPMDYESDHASSHDSYTGPLTMGVGEKIPSGNAYKQIYTIYKIVGTASVSYRGMPTIQKYYWEHPATKAFIYTH